LNLLTNSSHSPQTISIACRSNMKTIAILSALVGAAFLGVTSAQT
jgi:hypothetical protein